jgi:hypothetical protein
MSIITFDTFAFNTTLREGGFDEKQAAALTKAQVKASEQTYKESDYVSRQELKTDINELRKDMQLLEQGIRKDMNIIEEKITANLYKAMMIQTMAISGIVVAVVKLMH